MSITELTNEKTEQKELELAILNEAETRSNNNQHEDAIILFTEYITTNKQNPTAYNNRGFSRVKFYTQNPEHPKTELLKAKRDFTRAIKLSPSFPQPYINRAYVENELRMFNDAKEDCHRAIELEPEFPNAYKQLASAYLGLGHKKDAIAQLNRALQIDPEYNDTKQMLKDIMK